MLAAVEGASQRLGIHFGFEGGQPSDSHASFKVAHQSHLELHLCQSIYQRLLLLAVGSIKGAFRNHFGQVTFPKRLPRRALFGE